MSGPYSYTLFGLQIRSEIELPELAAGETGLPADVEVSTGRPPTSNGSEISFTIDGVGSYWVSSGSRINLLPSADAPAKNVRLFLLGSAMGAILHQRGILPLHANALGNGNRAFAVMGETGAGKSTLAAEFHDNGYRIIGDDVCAVSFDDADRPWVSPGIPRLRMWRDALLASGRDPVNFKPSFVGKEDFEKYDVPLSSEEHRPALLSAIYVLADGDRIDIVRLDGVSAAEAIFAHTYRGHLVSVTGSEEQHWSSSVRLIRSTPVFLLVRPRDLDRLGELCDIITRHFESLN